MSRDINGNYTLPSGNPVAPDTLIESAWANSTMNDIAAALSDSLSRSGQGGMLAPFKVADGSLIAPGLAFTNEPTSGLYRETVSTWWAVAAGVGVMKFTPTQVTVPSGVTLRVEGPFSTANPLTFASLTLTDTLTVGGITTFNNEVDVTTGASLKLKNPVNTHLWAAKVDNANKLSFSYDGGTPALELNSDNSALFYGSLNVNNKFTIDAATGAISGTTGVFSGQVNINGTTAWLQVYGRTSGTHDISNRFTAYSDTNGTAFISAYELTIRAGLDASKAGVATFSSTGLVVTGTLDTSGSIAVTKASGNSSAFSLVQTAIVRWNIVNIATSGEFRITESGVDDWLKIAKTTGTVTLPALKGVGTRHVVADANGLLSAP